VIDQRLVRALAHPLRVHILEILSERVASPIAISEELESELTDVAYHTRALDRCGCLDLVGTARKRGATEHFYKAQPRAFIGDRRWRTVPRALRGGISAAALQSFIDIAVAALEAGTIDDRDGATLCWTPLRVDARGWEEVREILDDALEQIIVAHERSRRRLARRRSAEELSTVVGVTHFETGGSRPG
jgi:hypothetical protein